jgi:predicted KAP-like P-loop ATPase
MRYSDRPITRPGEDALGRASFALELARSIDNLSVAGDGFVMALVGEWGSGKPRDIRRFIDAIAVAHSNLSEYTDAMDLILLIALQIFEPDVYWLVRRNIAVRRTASLRSPTTRWSMRTCGARYAAKK